MWGGIILIEFIDKTSEQSGTPINRKNLMAVQGFDNATIVQNVDGGYTIANSNGEVLTITFDNGILQSFSGQKTINKKITFNEDGSIEERVY